MKRRNDLGENLPHVTDVTMATASSAVDTPSATASAAVDPRDTSRCPPPCSSPSSAADPAGAATRPRARLVSPLRDGDC